MSSARNAGLTHASGEYIAWVDPDDWIEEDMIEYLLSNAQRSSSDITVCGRTEVYSNKQTKKGWEEAQELNTEQALRELVLDKRMGSYLWDKLWRAELFTDISFPDGKVFEDISIMHLLFERAKLVLCLPKSKYNYLQHESSIVGGQGLSYRIMRYEADKKRYDDLALHYPQLEPILEAKCMEAAVNVWQAYYESTKEQRKRCTQELKEIACFSKVHSKKAKKYMDLGVTGKMSVPLTQYVNVISFLFAKALYEVYSFLKKYR